eukprot:scaffold3907_cov48-Isochrysis_galbana.AAC.2
MWPAPTCPATRARSLSPSSKIFCPSDRSIFFSGTPVHWDTTAAMSSSPTVLRVSASESPVASEAVRDACASSSCLRSSGRSLYLSSAA